MSYVVFTNNFLSKTAGEAPTFFIYKGKNLQNVRGLGSNPKRKAE
jgi:hypothetical protein